MQTDEYDLPLNAPDAAAVTALRRSVGRLLRFRHGMLDPVEPWTAAGEPFPLASVLDAYVGALSTEAGIAAESGARFAAARRGFAGLALTDRERDHVEAAGLLLAGDLGAAGAVLARISMRHPRDLIALAVGHQVDFLRGDAVALRDRIGAVLPFSGEDDPHYGCLLGMYAFGAEENGHWEYAEELGRRAVSLDAENVWAIHAVAHTYEMRARGDDGLRWIEERRGQWDGDNYMRLHIAWHHALFLLEAGDADAVLRIYDRTLAPEKTSGTALEILNGSSLLWRLHLAGADVHDRFTELAKAWRPRAGEPWCAFNDWHAAMCFAGAGDADAAAELLRSRERYAAEAGSAEAENAAVTAAVGLPVCRAIVAFARGRHREVLDLLMPVRRELYRCGGSHAQRDVVHQTLLEAALRAGRRDEARTLVGERLAVRPASPFNRRKKLELTATADA
ncbi:tetratricopeptide repeat protein [Actinomadura rugatobispora]|uniref:Tetratricopeptide repeat protein 38 n=1 Tax=Actinomadura rugatobispora TaxID=1994 RepID=A0ABW0ZZK3_9ACTN|nr:tetratricopeptide repeat protein [Actinomadura rugatobispora]